MPSESIVRRYGYGFVQLAGECVCALPSQHLRRWFLTWLFGLKMGNNARIFRQCRLRAPWKIRLGEGAIVGGAVELDGRGTITIGNQVNISSEAMVWTAQHDHRDPFFAAILKAVRIEDYAWIGPRVIVLPGVTIGEGSVIGAGAVVTKSTQAYGIYIGIPARLIGQRNRNLQYSLGSNYTPFV